jgi:hypothetical protein
MVGHSEVIHVIRHAEPPGAPEPALSLPKDLALETPDEGAPGLDFG